MEYSVKYYIKQLDEKPELSSIGVFNFPKGRPYQFIAAVITASAMLSYLINHAVSDILFPALSFYFCSLYYFTYKLRDDILERCLVDECYMMCQAEEQGDNQPIQDDEREGIFDFNYSMNSCKPTFLQNFKFYYKELLVIAALDILVHLL